MYKIKMNNVESFIAEHSFYTRAHSDAVPVFYRLTVTQHAVSYVAPRVWNTIPQHIRNAVSVPQFKKQLKRHYIDNYE